MGHGFHLPTTAAGSIVLGLQSALPANPTSLPPFLSVDIAYHNSHQLLYYVVKVEY